jgi:hypothetical protein
MKSLFGKKTTMTTDLYLPAFVLVMVMAYLLTALPIGVVVRDLLNQQDPCSITSDG